MEAGSLQRLIYIFTQAFARMGINAPAGKTEAVAIIVHRAMTLQTRHFHTLEHVFTFVETEAPIRTLAGMFHDVVYYQVDSGLLPEIRSLIEPCVLEEEKRFKICAEVQPSDRILFMTMELFGLEPGQILGSITQVNEFLSALVMNRCLAGLVAEKDLLRMTALIEATIPFRGLNAEGKNQFEVLAERLEVVSKRYGMILTTEEIDETVQDAVLFSIKDIENFSEENAAHFLDNTWKLLPETNSALRSYGLYSVREYREALQKMEGFMNMLNAEQIFYQYKGVPDDEMLTRMNHYARQNVETGREYLRIKFVTASILEALAMLSGGDAPLALFMGENSYGGLKHVERLENYLPKVQTSMLGDRPSAIIDLLKIGRASDSAFDMRHSPLALFVYRNLEPEKITQAALQARKMFAGEISPMQFLRWFNHPCIAAIAHAAAQMVETRREMLTSISHELDV
jgi:hypothetical protein